MPETPEELYKKRSQRIQDAIQLKQPDRVPFVPYVTFFPAVYAGLSFEEAMHDYDKLAAAVRKFMIDFQPDALSDTFLLLAWAPTLEILDYKQLVWPGHGGKPNATYQFVEGEYMKSEEYDQFISDPSDFLLRRFIPRAWGLMEPLKRLRHLSRAWYTMSAIYVSSFGTPEMAEALEGLVKAGQEVQKMLAKAFELINEMESMGFPRQFVTTSYAPFDYIGDFLRGTRGILMDIYQNPEKLLEAIDKITPYMIEQATAVRKTTGINRVFMPLHKGIDIFMSQEQFKKFYWPSLRKVIIACIDAGLTPCPLFEGDCTSRLEIIGDIPKGKAVYWFERTSLFKAKEVLGDTVCIEGGVPSSIMINGTPEEVKTYCKKLIDEVGKNGGFILNGDVGIPDEANIQNVKTLATFVREYSESKW
jgi:uroporphyrinogen-III decarboxylase